MNLTFDHHHYVPALRWKRAERTALMQLLNEDRPRITPLIELIPKDFQTTAIQKVFLVKAREIAEHWREPFFLDLGHLPRELLGARQGHPLEALGVAGRRFDLPMVPVTSLDRPEAFQSALAALISTQGSGVCLRLTLGDLRLATLSGRLQQLLVHLGLSPGEAHMVIDCETVTAESERVVHLIRSLPFLADWRTFTVLGGAFPKDLSELEKNRTHELLRWDWLAYRDEIAPGLARTPSFGDYTTQYGTYCEPPKGGGRPSASIRYTAQEHWVVLRGEQISNPEGPGSAQWPAQAQLLCAREEFCGAPFSEGDKYIAQMAAQDFDHGYAESWLTASLNHHVTLVARQVAA